MTDRIAAVVGQQVRRIDRPQPIGYTAWAQITLMARRQSEDCWLVSFIDDSPTRTIQFLPDRDTLERR